MTAPGRSPALRVATRGSALALWQAEEVARALARVSPEGPAAAKVVVETSGDRRQDVPVWDMGGQGVFVKEVQAAVLDGRADIAVHSAKDLPSSTPTGLVLGAVLPRGDPRDALVGATLRSLHAGAVVATGSVRRRAQLAWLRPDLTFVSVRGNIATRLGRIPPGGALVIAAAALERLGISESMAEILDPSVMLPQVGQGAIAVECRADEADLLAGLSAIEDQPTRAAVDAERAFLAALGGGCDLPVGGYATASGGLVHLEGMLASGDGRVLLRRGGAAPTSEGKELGTSIAMELLAGGDYLLEEGRSGLAAVPRKPGMTVYLVGAGPGDPGLMTLRGAEVLARADVVVHDRLADPRLLDLAPERARRLDVGKSPGGPVDQEGINDILVAEGRTSQVVVRLKGGDPFVFGRGGEEALALQGAGVPFEVVPGISSAIAVPAYAGVPVTQRALATSFTVVTGHSRHAVDRETNWGALAEAGGTIVVLMGVAHRETIARRLIEGGLPAQTPVLAVRWGTRPEQRSVRTSLAELGSVALEPPVTIVIGSVAGLDLRWYEARPLFAKRVVVTRARAQASKLVTMLADLGARPIEVPTITIEGPSDSGVGLDRAASGLARGDYGAVVFTSANAVDPVLRRIADVRVLRGCMVAAVGPATAEAVVRHRLGVDVMPSRGLAEGLLEVFPDPPSPGARLLFPRAAEGREVLVDGLAAAGWAVDLVEAYRTVRASVPRDLLSEVRKADAACFTSSSTVSGFVAACGLEAVPPVVVCIGPATAATATDLGLAVDAIADPHDLQGLVDALVGVLGRTDESAGSVE